MSIQTINATPGDFEAWEQEMSPTHRPTRAAERRGGREQIQRELGIRRHRKHEREA